MSIRLSFVLAIALCVVTTAVYWPGLSGGFLFDDYPNILTNQRIHADTLSLETLGVAANGYTQGPIGRPLATISFAIDHSIGGKDPWTYKLTSLLIHLVNAVLVFWLLRRLVKLTGDHRGATGGDKTIWSGAAIFTIALLWAIHPLQVSSVLYVVQRMETLSLTFVLIALILYLYGRAKQLDDKRGWPWLFGSALVATIGLLSKETAILFPAYTLALELTLLGFKARCPATRSTLKYIYGVGVIIGAIVFITIIVPHYTAPEAYAIRDFTVTERLLTQLRALPMYLGQIILPLPGHLTFYYDSYPKSTGLLEPLSTLTGGIFLLSWLILALFIRKKAPMLALGTLWFFVAHALTSNILSLELVFEHRNYFALLGILLVLGDLASRVPARGSLVVRQTIVGILVLGIAALGILRSATWGDPLLLAMDLVAINPKSTRASSDLGEQYMILADGDVTSQFYAKAINEFERGSRLPSASPLPEQGLILMSALSGQPVADEWWDRIEMKLASRPIGPQESMMVLGLVQQRYKGAPLDDRRLADIYTMLAEHTEMPPLQYAHLGDHALTYLNDQELASAMFVKAIEHSVDNPPYAQQLVEVLQSAGHARQAQAAAAKAKELGLLPPLAIRAHH